MQQAGTIGSGNWSKAASIEEVLEHLFPVEALVDMLSIVWGLKKGSKILHVGSASDEWWLCCGRSVTTLSG